MPPTTPDDPVAALSRLLQEGGDGKHLLNSLFRGRPPRGLATHLSTPGVLEAEAVWPFPTRVQVDAAQLAQFRKAHPGALAGVSAADLESTKFQTRED
jgi:hypothetical protein